MKNISCEELKLTEGVNKMRVMSLKEVFENLGDELKELVTIIYDLHPNETWDFIKNKYKDRGADFLDSLKTEYDIKYEMNMSKEGILDVYYDEFLKDPNKTTKGVCKKLMSEFDDNLKEAINIIYDLHPNKSLGFIQRKYQDRSADFTKLLYGIYSMKHDKGMSREAFITEHYHPYKENPNSFSSYIQQNLG